MRTCIYTEYFPNGKYNLQGEVGYNLYLFPGNVNLVVKVSYEIRGAGEWALAGNQLVETILDLKRNVKSHILINDEGIMDLEKLSQEARAGHDVFIREMEKAFDYAFIRGSTESSKIGFIGRELFVEETKGDDGDTKLGIRNKTDKMSSSCPSGR